MSTLAATAATAPGTLAALTQDQLDFGLLALRLVIGPVFAFHGFAKIFRGGKLQGTAAWFDSMGMRPGWLHARLAAGGELATGICLTLGLYAPFAGMGMVGLMAVAFWLVHRGKGLLVTGNGWEYNLVLGAIGFMFGVVGAGDWSLDRARGITHTGFQGGAFALSGLLLAAILLAVFYRPPAKAGDEVKAGDEDDGGKASDEATVSVEG